MHVRPRGVLLFALVVWMQTGNPVSAQQDCQLASFEASSDYDSHFDTSGLEDSYPPGAQVRVPCQVGYVGFFKLLCLHSGWDYQGSKCQPKPCGHPGDSAYADFYLVEGDDFVFGSEVQYTCQTGYQMVSRIDKRRCMSDGWDGFLPVCEAKQCPAIHAGDDMQVTGENLEATYGHVLHFRCKQKHFVMHGPQQIYCQENAEWSAQPPTCKVKSCGRPDDAQSPAFRLTKGDDFIFGSEVQYTCQPGFQVTTGSITRRCTMNGWDRAVPVCDGCKSHLGIHYERKRVLDNQLTASSTHGSSYRPSNARLGNGACWFPATNDQHQWLQVDLRRPRTITGIITQGFGTWRSYYVETFKVSCSDDGRTWTAVRDERGAGIFTGNTDHSTYKENGFKLPITCRFVRVLPWAWNNGIALRMELLGCDD